MNLNIENTTGLLNDYFFQMLCLIYFPGEKFPGRDHAARENEPSASFFVSANDGVYECRCCVTSGEKTAEKTIRLTAEETVGSYEDEYIAQICSGKAFLLCCRELFGFTPPWGQMTGLRPVKRALFYLDRGRDAAWVVKMFKEDFSVSDEKAKLCVDIAQRQQKLFGTLSDGDCALYIAIPFCPTRCTYCSFVSYSGQKLFALLSEYLERLQKDIVRMGKLIKSTGQKLVSIYIGGGTPTILDESQLDALLETITESVDMTHVREFTLESGRPDTITDGKLTVAEKYSVTRISINTQTTDDNILKAIGRKHTAADFFAAYDIAHKHTLSLNTDLIAGLPCDTREGFARSLDNVISCCPDDITVHTMSVKNAAPIRFEVEGVYDPEGQCAKDCVSYARETLAQNNYYPYYLYRQKNTVGNAENCGYAKPGTECLYNIMTMEERHSVFACGASALTKIVVGGRIERFAFPKYPFEYLKQDSGVFEREITKLLCERKENE
ncbi:MAG TPA: coproporphyrinogen dehydrogenase HemZ [Bacillota bacterium]|nr:coproporphyrinogen dehydrogenase HemZ [Bacillota bacterium]